MGRCFEVAGVDMERDEVVTPLTSFKDVLGSNICRAIVYLKLGFLCFFFIPARKIPG
jgi:hypothetical protein